MRTNLLIPLIGAMLCLQKTSAQSSQTNFAHPWSATSQAFTGSKFPFHNPSKICSDNHQHTSSSALLNVLSGDTEYLVASNFGLSIPLDASIHGIEVKIIKSASGINVSSWVRDNVVRLVKNGVITGDDKATNDLWTTGQTTALYGGATDQWGSNWTVDDLRSASFGVAFSARLNGVMSLLPSASIYGIEIKVHYNVTLPLRLLHFDVKTEKDKTNWSWNVASLKRNTFFALQRSANTRDWEAVYSFRYTDKPEGEKSFAAQTPNTSGVWYYRLKMVDPEEKTTYSENKRVAGAESNEVSFYPNPARGHLFIKSSSDAPTISVYDLGGKAYRLPITENGGGYQKLDLQRLTPGYYVAVVENARLCFWKE